MTNRASDGPGPKSGPFRHRDAGDICALHRQLAGQLRRLVTDAAHSGPAYSLHTAGTQGFLHGRPLGGGGRRSAVSRAFRPVRRADDLRSERKSFRGHQTVNSSIRCRPALAVGVKVEVKEADTFVLVAHPSGNPVFRLRLQNQIGRQRVDSLVSAGIGQSNRLIED